MKMHPGEHLVIELSGGVKIRISADAETREAIALRIYAWPGDSPVALLPIHHNEFILTVTKKK